MNEYMPETWDAIESILGKENLLTEQDRELVRFFNEATEDQPIDLSNDENRRALKEALQATAARDRAKAGAAVARIAGLPGHSRLR